MTAMMKVDSPVRMWMQNIHDGRGWLRLWIDTRQTALFAVSEWRFPSLPVRGQGVSGIRPQRQQPPCQGTPPRAE
jgi:hypothetical protein